MSAPRHLWSGDWQRESDAAAAELAKRRGKADPEPPTEPESPSSTVPPPRTPTPIRRPERPAPPPGPSAAARVAASTGAAAAGVATVTRDASRRLRDGLEALGRGDRRRLGVAVVAALVSAAVAFGVVSVLVGGGSTSSAATHKGPGWLGIDMANSPLIGGILPSA